MISKNIILIFNFFLVLHSYKILVVNPKFGYSHVNFFSQIADILTEAGHDVTVLTVNIDPTIKHPGAYKANIITYPAAKEIEDVFTNNNNNKALWGVTESFLEQYEAGYNIMNAVHTQLLNVFNDNELSEQMKKEKFDLGIVEVVNFATLGMFKVWGIEAYITGYPMSLSDTLYKDFGIPFRTSFMPSIMSQFTDKMTYGERFQNVLISYTWEIVFYLQKYKLALQKEFDEKYGKGFFNSDTVIGDSSFILINSNPFLDIPGPKTPKMIDVSGISIKDIKPLDEYWDKILSLRSKNVMISFGTYAKTINMPKNLKNGLLETIKNLSDITFIWKYEEPEDGTGKDIENLILSKWFPQTDLLNDTRISLFVTHGGMGSTTELSFRGVPAIIIPIMGDQMRNSKLIERQNFGIIMNKLDLANPEILIKNIKTILTDDTYKKNAKMVSRRLNKRPIGSKRLLIEHVEFAAEFGKLEMLDLASRNMGAIEYYNLDIIFPLMLAFIIIISFSLYITAKIIKKLFKSKVKTDQKNFKYRPVIEKNLTKNK